MNRIPMCILLYAALNLVSANAQSPPPLQEHNTGSGGCGLLDESSVEMRIDSIRSGSLGTVYTGSGVIVGIYDSGIDWTHPDFIGPSGESRILFIWDQTDTVGSPPDGFDYGSEFTNADINTALNAPGSSTVAGRDFWGHGSHVAGIAAGNGRATGNGQPAGIYTGIAPESELIIVKGGDTHFIEKAILEGMAYIFNKAGELGKPAVINLSVGTIHRGPHDGSSSFETGLDNLLWESGRAIVVAAGNEGDDAIHFQGDFSAGSQDTLTFGFNIPTTYNAADDYVGIDIWYPAYAALSIALVTPAQDTLGPVSASQTWMRDEGTVTLTASSHGWQSTREMHIWLADSRTGSTLQDNLAEGGWQLLVQGYPGRFDGWIYASSMNARLSSGATYNCLVAEPGNARLAITVGAYTSRNEWPSLHSNPWGLSSLPVDEIASFSSPGPTRDGRQKPDISAPGQYILSAYSSMTAIDPPTNHFIALDSVHRAWSGTSMAAPHITGLAALLFEQNPDYNSSEIKSKLLQSARTDAYTGSCWNACWGFGKADALAALTQTAVYHSGTMREPRPGAGIYPNPFNGSTSIEFTVTGTENRRVQICILDIRGRALMQRSMIKTPGSHTIIWNGISETGARAPSGIYLLTVTVGTFLIVKKMILLN